MPAQSMASVPPTPAVIRIMAFFSSYWLVKRRAFFSPARVCSIEVSWSLISEIKSGSWSSRISWRSEVCISKICQGSISDLRRLKLVFTFLAFSGFCQSSGSEIWRSRSSSFAIFCVIWSFCQVVVRSDLRMESRFSRSFMRLLYQKWHWRESIIYGKINKYYDDFKWN